VIRLRPGSQGNVVGRYGYTRIRDAGQAIYCLKNVISIAMRSRAESLNPLGGYPTRLPRETYISRADVSDVVV
jgi:hypothetical protein